MAIVRKSLDELLANPPAVDHAKLAATTEAEIRQHMIEDDQDPDAPLGAFELVVPAKIDRDADADPRRAYGTDEMPDEHKAMLSEALEQLNSRELEERRNAALDELARLGQAFDRELDATIEPDAENSRVAQNWPNKQTPNFASQRKPCFFNAFSDALKT